MASQPPQQPTDPAHSPVDVPVPSPADPMPPTPTDPGVPDQGPDPFTEGP